MQQGAGLADAPRRAEAPTLEVMISTVVRIFIAFCIVGAGSTPPPGFQFFIECISQE